MKKRKNIKILFGKEGEVNVESFNKTFWSECSPQEKFDAAWDLVVQSYKTKNKDLRELRFQRHFVLFKPA